MTKTEKIGHIWKITYDCGCWFALNPCNGLHVAGTGYDFQLCKGHEKEMPA